jgi:hypothetical protein
MRTTHFERLTHACFLVVAVIAIGVLLSWWLGLGDVTLPGRAARPMAPTTAFLFLARGEKTARLTLKNTGVFFATLDVGLSGGARDWLKVAPAGQRGTAVVLALREAVEDGRVLRGDPDHVVELGPGAEAAFVINCEAQGATRQAFVLVKGAGLENTDRSGVLRLPAVCGPPSSGRLIGPA